MNGEHCMIISSSTINNTINNKIIPYIQNLQIPPNETITGTFNAMSFTSINVNGTQGNTTTTGYYYTYNAQIFSCDGLFNISVFNSSGDYTTCIGNQNQTSAVETLNFTYYTPIQSVINVQGKFELYLPQVTGTICETCCCGNSISSCCYNTCNCKNEIITPSTYTNDLLIPFGYTGTFSLTMNSGYMSFNYTTSNILPDGYIVSVVENINSSIPLQSIYVYDIVLESFVLNIQSVTATDIPEPKGGWNINSFNSSLNAIITNNVLPILNNAIKDVAIEIKFNVV